MSSIGSGLTSFGLGVYVFRQTGSAADMALVSLLAFLPTQGFARATAGTALNNRPSVALLSSLGFTQTATESVSFYQDSAGNPIVFTGGVFEKPLP